jgi:putative molybdopterin biosynthesis protein
VKQDQFLDVIDRDEAEARWHRVLDVAPLPAEEVPISEALSRVLAEDVRAGVDVPAFDRSNMDGFAVRAEDTFGASEEEPVRLRLAEERIPTGVVPVSSVLPATAITIATGGMLPRGADAVVPVEVTDVLDADTLVVRRAAVPGGAVSFAGTDMGRGETVLFAGTRLTSRETGVLAAIGCGHVSVVRKPRVAVISTGDEIVAPGDPLPLGGIYDSNGRILSDAIAELGAEPVFLGAFRDDEAALRAALQRGMAEADVVVLSGGTSKGQGDLNARLVEGLDPGVIVHGVALKPGKPICLAASGRQPVVVLPGFPTSAVFTFHEFVAPVIRRLLGEPPDRREVERARVAMRINSERGRLEYLLVGLVAGADGALTCYPMGKGSGSVTAFSRADGFLRIDRNAEIVEADETLPVTRIGRTGRVPDLVIIGSHCVGLDTLASALSRRGVQAKLLAVGSQGGLAAARRGECDIAPVHLLDPASGTYNVPFLSDELELVEGYRRMQGVLTRPDDRRDLEELLADAAARMVNRNRGSGTRIVIDGLLGDRRPAGYGYEPRSHYAVAAAVAQKRSDWGVAIEGVARQAGLRFQPLVAEHYDFVIPRARRHRPAVEAFVSVLREDTETREALRSQGFEL